MASEPPPNPAPETMTEVANAGDSSSVGAGTRVFPCESCGADLTFNIGAQSLKCPYCGFIKALELDAEAEVAEQDFRAMLERIAQRRGKEGPQEEGVKEVRCGACGAGVRFTGAVTSTECAYCGAALQLAGVYDAPSRVPVDGVLPFKVSRAQARENLGAWVRSRWFAPNEFKARGVQGRFNGVFMPYWTFDSLTACHYSGQRGVYYWVTTGSGKNRRRVRRIRWYPVSGSFQRFFDDLLIVAASGVPTKRVVALEPWPLKECVPFNREMLAGFLARTYEVELDRGFAQARIQMAEAIEDEARRRIGGDVQRIGSINTAYQAITYKHLLLPVWMLAYRYCDKAYQVVVNAGTGEVQGDRPYSWVKITLAVVGALGTAAVFHFLQCM